jgi:hypothetical protein
MAEFTFADIAAGTFVPCIKLPAGAAIVQGYLGVKTASGAALTLSLGTAAAPANLLIATSVAALGKTAITAALSNYGCPQTGRVIGITPSAASSTLLEGVVVIEYIVAGRSSTTES